MKIPWQSVSFQTFYHQTYTQYQVRRVRRVRHLFFLWKLHYTSLLQDHNMQQIEML